ncbi:MAG: ATP-binding protein [Acidobacteriota bacterium]
MAIDSGWTVNLEVPADSRHLHVVRLTAAGAAAEAGLTAEEVEDVKIAVDELCSVFIAAASSGERIGLRFEAREEALVVEADGPDHGELEVDDLARTILDATVDELAVGGAAPGGGFRLRKHRRGR